MSELGPKISTGNSDLHTSDNEIIPWPYGDGAKFMITTITADTVRGLLVENDFALRCVNVSMLTVGQMGQLYREQSFRMARQMRLIGRRIRDTDTLAYAQGIGRKKIVRIYHCRQLLSSRRLLIEELLRNA